MQQIDATISDATTLRAEDGPAPPLPDLAEPTCSASQRESRTVPETGGEWRPGMLGGIFAWTGRAPSWDSSGCTQCTAPLLSHGPSNYSFKLLNNVYYFRLLLFFFRCPSRRLVRPFPIELTSSTIHPANKKNAIVTHHCLPLSNPSFFFRRLKNIIENLTLPTNIIAFSFFIAFPPPLSLSIVFKLPPPTTRRPPCLGTSAFSRLPSLLDSWGGCWR